MSFPYNQIRGASSNLNGLYGQTSRPSKLPSQPDGIRNKLGPDGFWDQVGNKRGPLEPLERDHTKKNKLEKNILTNQIQHVQYVNITHVVIPPRLPNSEDSNKNACWLDLCKTIHAGDVVFALRCPTSMIASQFASRMTRKSQFNYAFTLNLASLNYVLFRLQSFFYPFAEVCCGQKLTEIMQPAGQGDDGLAALDRFKAALRSTKDDLVNLSSARFNLWMHWFDHIIASSASKSPQSLQNILGWAMEDKPTDFPCFFEVFWYKYLEKLVGRPVPTDAESKANISLALQKLFVNEVNSVLKNWIQSNTQCLGIFIGSEEQGGAHQESKNPAVSFPNDYVGVIQVSGKSRRVSNLWNRNDHGFSSGDALGFALRSARHVQWKLNEDGSTTEIEKMSTPVFRLSSNVNTSADVSPHGIDKLLPLIGEFSVLTPVVKKYCIYDNALDKTFWQFACANQMSRPLNTMNNAVAFARNAMECGLSPPIEVIMRRTYEDWTDYTTNYLERKFLSACFAARGLPGGGRDSRFSFASAGSQLEEAGNDGDVGALGLGQQTGQVDSSLNVAESASDQTSDLQAALLQSQKLLQSSNSAKRIRGKKAVTVATVDEDTAANWE